MKFSKVLLIKFVVIIIVTILIITNPGSQKYEVYAAEQLTTYLKEHGCRKITEQLNNNFQTPCQILINTARPQIKTTISHNTQHKNFFLFSLYNTRLSITPLMPVYQFETLGILDRFFIYQAETN